MFEIRALELHATVHIWDPKKVLEVLDRMVALDLDTLVLHEVQMVERLVYPGRYFGSAPEDSNIYERYRSTYESLYRYTPGRRSKPYLYMETLRWTIRRAAERGIAVYLNNKELFFPDVLLEFEPQLVKDGVLCPSEPFWLDFLRAKYRELYEDLPDLAGTITAPGTGESRLSFSANRCPCERCAGTSAAQWYGDVIRAIHEPTAAAGKQLVVRDFVFDKAAHDQLATAFEALPADVAVCLKNTPHDYYPTFPDNPRIGDVGPRAQWVEFDAMGQYFGWGVAPAVIVDDTRARFQAARDRGVRGVLVRVDWESLDGHSSFDTPNVLNLYAMARLATDPGTSTDSVYREWLTGEGHVPADVDAATLGRCVAWARDALDESWPIVRGSLFADGCVFSDSSSFPVGLDNVFWLAEVKNSLRDWDPAKADALAPTPGNIARLVAEKDEALTRWRRAMDAMAGGNPGLVEERYADLVRRFRVFGLYVEGFRHIMAAAITARHLVERGDAADDGVAAQFAEARSGLDEYLARIDGDPAVDWFPATHLVNAQRLRAFRDDVVRRVEALEPAGVGAHGGSSERSRDAHRQG